MSPKPTVFFGEVLLQVFLQHQHWLIWEKVFICLK